MKNMKKNSKVALIVCLMLVVCVASIGGTIAWLTDSTETVVNTFTASDIAITLTETPNNGEEWEAQLIPGKSYSKNPVVAVDGTETNVDVYLFVKFEEENNTIDGLTGKVVEFTDNLNTTNGWTQLTGDGVPSTVWYREVKTTASTKSWNLIGGNEVTINTGLTKEMMENAVMPSLSYTAYAIQTQSFENNPLAAWNAISK